MMFLLQIRPGHVIALWPCVLIWTAHLPFKKARTGERPVCAAVAGDGRPGLGRPTVVAPFFVAIVSAPVLCGRIWPYPAPAGLVWPGARRGAARPATEPAEQYLSSDFLTV